MAHGRWKAVLAPEPRVPARTQPLTVSSVHCMAAGACVAVGTVLENPCQTGCGPVPNANVRRVVVLSDRNGTWRASAPLDVSQGLLGSSQLGVDCTSKATCVIVGATVQRGSNPAAAVIGVSSGLKWTFSKAPAVLANGSAHGLAEMGPIACRATCVIGALWTDAKYVAHPAAVYGTPGHWSSTSLPFLPTSASWDNLQIDGTACGSGSNCVISGSVDALPGGTETLLYERNGKSWIRVHVAIPKGDHADAANTIACPPSGACRAFTNYFSNPDGPFHLMVLTQAQGAWSPLSRRMNAVLPR